MHFHSIRAHFRLILKSFGITLFLGTLIILMSSKAAAFRFVAWGDTKTATSVLSALSNQVASLSNPNVALTIYLGDSVDSWSQLNFDAWLRALNGGSIPGNNLANITFPVRGNHEGSGSTTGWQNSLNLSNTATFIGANHYTELTPNIVYSFDYQNSHFVGLDVLGDANTISATQLNWLEADVTTAEQRGIKHTFIFFHGPLYCTNGHCTCTVTVCTPTNSVIARVIDIFNHHPSISAVFHGHEHVITWTHIDASRIPEITQEYEQFISGDAGAGPSVPTNSRVNYSLGTHGFMTVDVNSDSQFTANWYQQGSNVPVKSQLFTKPGAVTPTPTLPQIAGDSDGDRDIDGVDIWNFTHLYNTLFSIGDLNHDGKVNLYDFSQLLHLL